MVEASRTLRAAGPAGALRAQEQGRRPAAPVGLPVGPAHLRPGDRRREGPHARRRLDASTRALKAELKTGADREAARRVGLLLAERAKAAGVEAVMFDRGGYKYHGRVKALADGAREGGLAF